MSRDFPSVTEVLKFYGMYGQYAQWITDDRYMRRGRMVHMAAHILGRGQNVKQEAEWIAKNEYHAEHCAGESTNHTGCIRLVPYLDAYRKFLAEHDFVLKASEIEVRHEALRYIGHPDQIGILDGKPALIDIKTGDCPDAVKLQTAAYLMAFEGGCGRRRRYGLQLKLDGTYKLWPCDDFRDRDEWTYLIGAYNVRAKYVKE